MFSKIVSIRKGILSKLNKSVIWKILNERRVVFME